MMTITKQSPNRVDIDLSGGIDIEIMTAGLDDLIAKSEGVEHGVMLYRITDFTAPSLGALAVELAHLPKLLALIGKFDRCAVLADESWLRTVAEVEGAVIPGLDIKSFELADAEAAEAWLAESV